MRPKHPTALLAALLLIIGLSGCAVLRVQPTGLQSDTIGDVIVHVDVCASNVGSCPATSSAEADQSSKAYDVQMLLGFLIPDGVVAPGSFDTSSGPAGSFARNDSYEGGLELRSPAPAGSHWVGYAATTAYHWKGTANPALGYTADPAFLLPSQPGGAPFRGPFDYRVVVGIRGLAGTVHVGDPIDCAQAPISADTLCSEFVPGHGHFGDDLSLPTRDLGVSGSGAPATANPGGTVSVPFNLRYAGAATPAAAFSLSAVSDLPGVAPALSQDTLTPASDSDNSVLATVSVPPGTAPGSYSVTLTAALPNGQTRTGTSALTVAPANGDVPPPPDPPGAAIDRTPPAAHVAIRRTKLGALVRSRRLGVTTSLSEAGSVRLAVKVPARLRSKRQVTLRATVVFTRRGSHSTVLRLSRRTAAALRGRRLVALRVSAGARDLAGNVSVAAARRTFKR